MVLLQFIKIVHLADLKADWTSQLYALSKGVIRLSEFVEQ
jgi:hypothetical protein